MLARKLTAMLASAAASFAACASDAPFEYPSSLLESQASYSEPAGGYVRLGKPTVVLGVTTLEEAARYTGASRLRDGSGVFARDYMCLESSENGVRYLTWLVSSDTKHVTEAQIERISNEDQIPGYCRLLRKELQPVRLGKFGMPMSASEVNKFIGKPSSSSSDGWSYWFSQRFLRNEKNLQELELNWLAVEFNSNGTAVRAFASTVKNP